MNTRSLSVLCQGTIENIENARHASVFVCIWGFVLGVLIASFISILPATGIFFVCVGVAILVAEKISRGEIYAPVFLLGLLCISFGIGIVRYDIKDFHRPAFVQEIGSHTELSGFIVQEPERRDTSVRFVLRSHDEHILVITDMYSPVLYGDEVHVEGILKEPEMIEVVTGIRPFNYPAYLSKDDVYYTMQFARVEILSRGHGNFLIEQLLGIKQKFITNMRAILPEPESSLLAGLIIAGKEAMPKSVLNDFTRAGVVHIVVLSGYNITIIASFFMKAFGFLSRRKAAVCALLAVFFFVLMAGASATIVRAAIMAVIAMLGIVLGRKYSATRALFVAGTIMVIENPKILVFDPSFQLSFLATFGLINIAPIIESYMQAIPEKWGIRLLMATTIATQIIVLPYLLYTVGSVSIVSLFSNILILLFIPITMLVGFTATITAFVHPYIALPFSYTAHIFLSWIIGVAHILGNLPFASITIKHFPFWGALVLYAVYVVFYIWIKKRADMRVFRVQER